jgi:hypothetical protein
MNTRIVTVKADNLRIGDIVIPESWSDLPGGRIETMYQVEFNRTLDTRVWDLGLWNSSGVGTVSLTSVFGDSKFRVKRYV